jgi:hypothetical protein
MLWPTTADDDRVGRTFLGWISRIRAARAGGFEATSNETIRYGGDAAVDRLRQAVGAIGKVTTRADDVGIVRGSVRYGLSHASVKITFRAVDDHSTIVTVNSCGEDRWGIVARSAINRILEAVDRLDEPNYHPNRFGPSIISSVCQVAVGCALLFGGLYVWFSLIR